MRRLFVKILFIVCSVKGSTAGELPAWIRESRPAHAPALVIPAVKRINEALQGKGTVKLIVRLAPPSSLSGGFVIEGHLKNSDAVARQRAHIAEVQNRVAALLSRAHADNVKKYDFIPYMALDATPSEFEALVASKDINLIEEDVPVPPTLYQSVPFIGAVNGAFNGFTGSGQTVAILDTGVDKTHPFLAGKIISEACFSSTYVPHSATPLCAAGSTGSASGAPCPSTISACSHGTHVAGIVAGNGGTFNGSQVSGVARDATIIAIQVFSRIDDATICGGTAPCVLSYGSDQLSALNHVYNLRNTNKISSVNLSLGGGSYTTNCDADFAAEKTAIDTLRSVGVATIIASGNDGYKSSISAPACISSAISVGATGKTDAVASYSNMASILNLLAPGSSVYSSVPGGGYSLKSGTSMATPHVAGAWAILKSAKPSASVDEVLAALTSTGTLITDARSGAPATITKPRVRLDAAVYVLKPPGAPSVTTNAAGEISASAATLQGTVNGNGAATSVGFDYGLNTSYGTNVVAANGGSIPALAGISNSSTVVTSLTCNSTYHFRAKATNSVGTRYGGDQTFTTKACVPGAPVIISASAGNSRAIISFAPPALDGGSAITGFTVISNIGQSINGTEIPITMSNLKNGTTYTFMVTATNAAGTGPASETSVNVIPGVAVIDDAYETGYQLLQHAYDADMSGEKMKLLAGAAVGDLTVDPSNGKGTVAIKGGYDDAFSGHDGLPSILGKVTLSSGKTIFQNVIVRMP